MKMTGGVIDVFAIIGDNAEQVVQQYTSMIGRPEVPPFWALGFHNGRWGYGNTDNIKNTIQRYYRHNVPLDVQHVFSEYMEAFRDFTYDAPRYGALPQFIMESKASKNSLRWSLELFPEIELTKFTANGQSYKPWVDGAEKDVFIKWSEDIIKRNIIKFPPAADGHPFVFGKALVQNYAVFPDFMKDITNEWWINNTKVLYNQLNFDSIYLSENTPRNIDDQVKDFQCPPDTDYFKIVGMQFREPLHTQTLCPDAQQGGSYTHGDVHSLYGLYQTKPTLRAIRESTGKRGLVISDSTFPGSGMYAGHAFTYISARWELMRQSIISMMEYSLFGMPLTGADICGLIDNSPADLCRRWYQLGAFYPFSRSNSAGDKSERDPGWWAENGYPEVTKAAVEALRLRYQFLHYYYTAFYNAHVNGDTVARPMHHVFTVDEKSRITDTQFFLGPSIMVTPFVQPNIFSLDAYLPQSEPDWFKLSNDFVEKISPVSEHMRIEDFDSSRPLFFRGGSVLPVVSVGDLPEPLNTVSLRKAPISLWFLPSFEGLATGKLFFDDGESIDTIGKEEYVLYDFSLKKCVLTITADFKKFNASQHPGETLKLKQIYIALDPHSLNDIRQENIDFSMEKDKTAPNATLTLEPKRSIRLRFAQPFDLFHSISNTIKITLYNKEDSGANCFLDN